MFNFLPLTKSWFIKVTQFFKTDVWVSRPPDLPTSTKIAHTLIRIILITFDGFKKHRINLRASALTFYSLLSLVPVLAMIFGAAKGFGVQNSLKQYLTDNFSGQEALITPLLNSADRLLETAKGGVIAGTGIVILFYTVIKLFEHIEVSFNHIWNIKTNRPLSKKFSAYLSIFIISPVFLTISNGLTIFLKTQIALILAKISILGLFSPIIFFLLKLLPYSLLWVLFSMVYILMPNTKVKFLSGLFAGTVAGTAFSITQWAYITFQIGTAKYNAIYGSFAALPLFLVWLQIAWTIILLGAEISYAYQINKQPGNNRQVTVSMHLKKQIALYITHGVVKRFEKGLPPQTSLQIAGAIQCPAYIVMDIIQELADCRILSTIWQGDENEPAFQPAFDIQRITVHSIIDALENNGDYSFTDKTAPEFNAISKALDSFHQIISQCSENKLIKDISNE